MCIINYILFAACITTVNGFVRTLKPYYPSTIKYQVEDIESSNIQGDVGVDTSSDPLYLSTAEQVDLSWDPFSAPKLNFAENYYKILEVDSRADDKSIKRAYKKLVFNPFLRKVDA